MVAKVLALLAINDDEPQALAEYLAITLPLLKHYGGEVLQRTPIDAQLVGHGKATLMMIVEYPSAEQARALFASAEYRSAIPHRDRAFSHYEISLLS